MLSLAATSSTYVSSGEAAIEQRPPGSAAAPPVQFVPPSVERKWPSSPQTSTVPPDWTTTSQTLPAFPAPAGVVNRFGSTYAQVTPESVLIATPQFVPT